MYVENIIKDIKELIYDNRRAWNAVFQSKQEAFRDDDLSEALSGMDRAMDGFADIEHRLNGLIHALEMEMLSERVHRK